MSAVVFAVELVTGLMVNSLALVADAGHVLSDVAGIGIALLAIWFARRPASSRRTFGFYRMEILAAVVNAGLLFAVAGLVLLEGWRRLGSQPEISTGPMLAVAIGGLAVNAASALLLHQASKESLNMRGAYLEVLGDAAGSVAVIGAAIVIMLTGLAAADAIASLLIGMLIMPRAFGLLREAIDVLLEATPKGTDLEVMRHHILHAPGVTDVHDLHAWAITSGLPVVSAHVVVKAGTPTGTALERLYDCLADCFDVEHSTFQIETDDRRHREHATHA